MKTLSAIEFPQGSEAWLRARVGVITASRFADAFSTIGGLDEKQQLYVDAIRAGQSEKTAMEQAGYKKAPTASVVERAVQGLPITEPSAASTAYAWLIAMERIAGEPLDDTFVTYAMRRGRELEPTARAVYESHTRQMVEEVSLSLTDDGRFGYSTDGLVGDDGLIEIKVPFSPEKIAAAWLAPERAADEYIAQIMGGLWITGRKWCDLVIYCPWLKSVKRDLFVRRIHRDEAAIEALEDDAVAFMRRVDAFERRLRGGGDVTPAPAPQPPALTDLLAGSISTVTGESIEAILTSVEPPKPAPKSILDLEDLLK